MRLVARCVAVVAPLAWLVAAAACAKRSVPPGKTTASAGSGSGGAACLPKPMATSSASGTGGAAPVGGACNCPKLAEQKLGGKCAPVITHWPDEGHTHVAIGTPVVYCTNPPSSGFHYPIWAAYQTYPKPVPHGFAVHSLEHGAIVVWYKCASAAGCPDTEKALQAVIDALPYDKECYHPGTGGGGAGGSGGGPHGPSGVRNRIILVPEPTLAKPVAASAWQWTYSADCVDAASLTAFITTHYNHATEDLCNNGIDPSEISGAGGGGGAGGK